jgi:hypothetical protein
MDMDMKIAFCLQRYLVNLGGSITINTKTPKEKQQQQHEGKVLPAADRRTTSNDHEDETREKECFTLRPG